MNEQLMKQRTEYGPSEVLTFTTLLEQQQIRLEKAKENVKQLEELINLLEEHPEIEKIFSLLNRIY